MENILLVGNPNSGKTTLFNSITRADEHVGNWHGVTVEDKRKTFDGGNFCLVDTPGIYSLSAFSFEEEVSIKIIEEGQYKKIINICDLNNLQRNLYLTLCLIEAGADVVVAINEIDKKSKYKVDTKKMSQLLGVDICLINAQKNIGTDDLIKKIKKNTRNIENTALYYLKNIDFSNIKKYFLNKNKNEIMQCCIKAFERNRQYFLNAGFGEDEVEKLFADLPENSLQIIAEARYNFLDEVIKASTIKSEFVYGKSKLDKVLLNKYMAFPCFLAVLCLIFYLTFFSLGKFLSNGLSNLLNVMCSPLLNFLEVHTGRGFVYLLISDALLGGLATLLSFLPQVVLLFFFLSLLEDSGYLSRVAFVFEDIFGLVGLSGKSVYTLLMGFGCSTSAIMTARNMDNKNGKIKTAMLCPYMSCTAKIPIYTIVGGAFFGAKNIFVILGLYFLGVIIALIISKILDATLLKSKEHTFILEFPPYRATSFKRVLKILWKNVKSFIIKVGSVMISMNIIVFILSSFNFKFQFVEGGEGSILQSISKFIAPIFEPLGFNNWAIVSALLAGFVAKEIVVSSIAMFNGIDASATRLISESIMLSSSVVYFSSKSSVLSFLVFCLLYTPCLASISMLSQEIGAKWTAFAVVLQLSVAYVVSFLIYNISLLFELFGGVVGIYIAVFIAILLAIICIIKKILSKKCAFCDSCNKKCKKKREKN